MPTLRALTSKVAMAHAAVVGEWGQVAQSTLQSANSQLRTAPLKPIARPAATAVGHAAAPATQTAAAGGGASVKGGCCEELGGGGGGGLGEWGGGGLVRRAR